MYYMYIHTNTYVNMFEFQILSMAQATDSMQNANNRFGDPIGVIPKTPSQIE